ncbi:MAG: AAA family ATPase [Polyangiaceae bacterium]
MDQGDRDHLVEWLFLAYPGTTEIHDVTPEAAQNDAPSPRRLVLVNDAARSPRHDSIEWWGVSHRWIVPSALWQQVLGGQASLPEGYNPTVKRSFKRAHHPRDERVFLHDLSLLNFRRFESTSLTFSPGFNVVIGKNGAGKSTILDALAMGLSGVVQPLHRATGKTFSHASLPLRDVRMAAFDKGGTLTTERQFPARIAASLSFLGERLTFGPEASQSGGATFAGPGRAISFLDPTDIVRQAVQDGFDVTLPVIAYYGTGRLWRGGAPQQGTPDSLSRFAGYQDCLDPSTDLSAMKAWFRRMELMALQDGRAPLVLETTKRAILSCLQGFDLVRFDARLDDLAARSAETGVFLAFDQLSDGQRNMLGMVADIAYRAATLNPHLGSEAAERSPGVVLIDEIDLHLHPAWQRRVLDDLRRAFPNLQIIASTHSAQILASAKRDEVILLSGGEAARDESFVEGRDSNSLLEDIFGVPARPAAIGDEWAVSHRLSDG